MGGGAQNWEDKRVPCGIGIGILGVQERRCKAGEEGVCSELLGYSTFLGLSSDK